jgi:2-polyprenyl-6-methoxyphenol hydroxylase-like FAD-dependent oxidoreductase
VKLKDKLSTQESNLMGDLIVDATGPSSRCSEWLEEIGLKKPPIEEIQINYNQIAYRARWGDNFNPDWMYTVYRKAGLRKGGYFMRIEDDKEGRLQWLFAIVTHFGEPLEKRKEDFDNISSQLENTTFGEAVKNSIHLTELGQYRVPKIRRKIFSQMDPLPKGFIAIGDAQCIWAPHTGLGLTIGALAALALKETLENKEFSNLSRGYFKRSEQLINTYWNRSIKVVPVVDASTLSPFGRFVLWYKKKLVTYSFKDRQLWKETLGFACNEKSVGSLFYPPILLKMFLHMLGVMK